MKQNEKFKLISDYHVFQSEFLLGMCFIVGTCLSLLSNEINTRLKIE